MNDASSGPFWADEEVPDHEEPDPVEEAFESWWASRYACFYRDCPWREEAVKTLARAAWMGRGIWEAMRR